MTRETTTEAATTVETTTSRIVGVGSPFDHTLSTLETSDNDQSLDQNGRLRTIPTERSNVVTATEVVVPTVVQATSKGVGRCFECFVRNIGTQYCSNFLFSNFQGGWVALGVILGLLLLLLLLILIVCMRR